MKSKDFDRLEYLQKLILVQNFAKEVDSIIPHFGPLRIVTMYALQKFFVALDFDLTNRKILSIKAFNDIHYLNKHTRYTAKLDLSPLKIISSKLEYGSDPTYCDGSGQ